MLVGVGSPEEAGRTVSGVRAAYSFESRKGGVSTSNIPIWSRCSIAPTYFFRSHFQRTLNRERRSQD